MYISRKTKNLTVLLSCYAISPSITWKEISHSVMKTFVELTKHSIFEIIQKAMVTMQYIFHHIFLINSTINSCRSFFKSAVVCQVPCSTFFFVWLFFELLMLSSLHTTLCSRLIRIEFNLSLFPDGFYWISQKQIGIQK